MNPGKPISRREFLRLAGRAGALVSLGAAAGSLLGACEDEQATSNTIATIVAGPTTTTTTTELPITTVSTSPAPGGTIRIGLVSPKTGSLALLGRADDWWIGFGRAALPDRILCGDGRLHRLAVLTEDSRSDSQRAAEAAAELIMAGSVRLIICSGSAEMAGPVANLAETVGCPCLSNLVLWQRFLSDRQSGLRGPFKWTYAHAVGLEDIAGNYLAMWSRLQTNNKVGFIFGDDARGRVWADAVAGLPAVASAAGYEPVQPGLYPPGTQDFTAFISEFQAQGCEICCGAMPVADLITFWKQAASAGYQPKIVTMGEALGFPQALQAMGPRALYMTTESLWHPDWPYTDSITGMSALQMAADYQAKTGTQWTSAIGQYAAFEWAVDVFKRARDVDDKDAVIAAVKSTRLNTCLGPLDFTTPVDATDPVLSRRPAENVCKSPVAGVQWVKGDGFDFEPEIVTNVNHRDLPAGGVMRPMVYESP